MASTKVIRTGSRALLVYPAGDCDYVRVQSINHDHAIVKLPGGKLAAVCIEDLGIGVDDDIVAVFEDGCVGVNHGDHEPVEVILPKTWTLTRTYETRLPSPTWVGGSLTGYGYRERAVAVHRWYDPSTRSWVVYLVDEVGNQIGPSEYCGTADWAVSSARALFAEALGQAASDRALRAEELAASAGATSEDTWDALAELQCEYHATDGRQGTCSCGPESDASYRKLVGLDR